MRRKGELPARPAARRDPDARVRRRCRRGWIVLEAPMAIGHLRRVEQQGPIDLAAQVRERPWYMPLARSAGSCRSRTARSRAVRTLLTRSAHGGSAEKAVS